MKLITRVTGTLILCSLLFLCSINAQQPVVHITPQTLEVAQVLKQLQEKAGLNFIYSGLRKELSQRVSLSPSTAPVSDILKQINAQADLEFSMSGNTVAIRLAKKVNGAITGSITDAGRAPVLGATILLKENGRAALTDEQGRFSFKDVKAGRYTLEITHVSYEAQRQSITVTGGKTAHLRFTLHAGGEKKQNLNPVIVTGQYRPQSLDKSIYRVEVITKEQIQNMAVSNIGELLKQQINIDIVNESGMGRSKIRLLGLNSQYVKILMDNIPIAGDQNMGSDVDLTTISLDDVERVEIVKGAMGVEYGANSIGGLVNIITKKTSGKKTDVSLELQEETVREEYNLNSDKTYEAKGRHIQKLSLSQRIASGLSVGGSVSRDKFNGYRGEYDGHGIITKPLWYTYVDESGPRTEYTPIHTRGYEWSPKESWNGNVYISYTRSRLNLFYKFNYFNSVLTNYARDAAYYYLKLERIGINASTNDDYKTTRFNHHLSARGSFWKNAYYTLDASFQKNGLEHRRYAVNLQDNSVLDPINGTPDGKPAIDWEKYYQSQGFYAKGSLVKPIVKEKLEYNLGFEMDNTTGNEGNTSWFGDVSLNNPVERTLFTGAAYTSAEWKVSKRIMIRPGFRLNYSNKVNMRTNESVTTRFRINERNDMRLIAGTSTRFPNYEEMYTWFVNLPVHDYRGNPDLRPEYGKSIELQWARKQELNDKLHLETSLSTMFQHIKDRIVPITYRVPEEPSITGRNTWTNENKYNGLLNQLNVNLVSDKFNFAIAGSALGYRGDDDATVTEYKGFLTVLQGSVQAAYVLPLDIRLSAFYRYVGREPKYVMMGEERMLFKTEAYHNMDANIARSFLKKRVDLRVGVRNIFDVRDIKYLQLTPGLQLGDYGAAPAFLRLFYGRSWFAKLTFNLFN
ncbi:TonB-dependent receptor domain-containing protein [Niabella aquatica]